MSGNKDACQTNHKNLFLQGSHKCIASKDVVTGQRNLCAVVDKLPIV